MFFHQYIVKGLSVVFDFPDILEFAHKIFGWNHASFIEEFMVSANDGSLGRNICGNRVLFETDQVFIQRDGWNHAHNPFVANGMDCGVQSFNRNRALIGGYGSSGEETNIRNGHHGWF